ncbi:MAG: CAP domain-containing protein [Capnocytophaga sp.]|nr:CAP domain-containing protein [Capnocytophaga sp.]
MNYLKISLLIFAIFLTQKAISQQVNPEEALNLVNSYRISGCDCDGKYYPPVPPLVWSIVLEKIAQKHSDDMHHRQFLSHRSSNGSSPEKRLDKAGYKWKAFAENVAMGQLDQRSAIDSWIKSKGHCTNIMNPHLTEMAIAVKGKHWTQLFATPKDK